jgi:hypothetical protein
MRPIRLQLRLRVVALHTESSDTIYSGGGKFWIQSCIASCSLPGDQSHRKRLADGLLENPSTMGLGLDVEVASVQPHDASHSPQ